MWLESIKAGWPIGFEELHEKHLLRETTTIPKKYEAYDNALSAILKALMDQRAQPELTVHKKTIKRSGIRARILLQESINGTSDVHGTSLVQEALTRRVIRNNADGFAAFLQRFRATQTKLGSSMPCTWGVETLRARMMHDIGDPSSCSWQLAEAAFAQYESRPSSQQTQEKADELLDRIELAAENLARHRRGRGKTKGGKNDRGDTAMLTGAFGEGKGQKVCEDCGGNHDTKNCWSNADKVIARREAGKVRKAKKARKGADAAHLTQAQKGPGDGG